MPDTVNIGGTQVDKRYLYAAGAVAAGIVGYAWWTRGFSGGAEPETDPYNDALNDDSGVTGFAPVGSPPMGAQYEGDSGTINAIKNNAEWSQFVINHLMGLGVEPTAVSSAIGKFLGRRQLTSGEADLVRQALAVGGFPPEGRPWTVIESTAPPAAVGLSAPTGLKGTGSVGRINWTWNGVTGATGFDWELVQGQNSVIRKGSSSGPAVTTSGLSTKAGTPYRLNVYARNSAGTRGLRATAVARTGSAPTTPNPTAPTTAKLRAPRAFRASATKTDIAYSWQRVPGAKAYAYDIIIGTNTRVGGGLTPDPHVRMSEAGVRGQPGKPYRIRVRAIDNNNKLGPAASFVARTDR